MELNLTLLIIVATGFISYRAFESPSMLSKWMLIPFDVKYNQEYYRLISHGFIHRDLIHLVFNLYVLYSFGSALEMVLCHLKGTPVGLLLYVLIYFGGVVAATLPAMVKHHSNAMYRSLGASGGVSSALMAVMMLFPNITINFFFFIPIKAVFAVPLFFVIEYLLQRQSQTRIAHDAHISGAVFGLVCIICIEPGVIPQFIDVLMGRM
jgi:membrane associated rhomboid family serine protease